MSIKGIMTVVGYATALLAFYNEANRAGLVDMVKPALAERGLIRIKEKEEDKDEES